jgi:hypothetical protein
LFVVGSSLLQLAIDYSSLAFAVEKATLSPTIDDTTFHPYSYNKISPSKRPFPEICLIILAGQQHDKDSVLNVKEGFSFALFVIIFIIISAFVLKSMNEGRVIRIAQGRPSIQSCAVADHEDALNAGSRTSQSKRPHFFENVAIFELLRAKPFHKVK